MEIDRFTFILKYSGMKYMPRERTSVKIMDIVTVYMTQNQDF